jgi:hypothetical protein
MNIVMSDASVGILEVSFVNYLLLFGKEYF